MKTLLEAAESIFEASLYIHIPFCSSKCGYCSFYSVDPSGCDSSGYVRKIAGELSLMEGKRVPTIYIGGGDPGTLSLDLLSLLLDALAPFIRNSAETTIEMNPEQVTEKKLDLIASSGITRISLGVQSLDPWVRNILGRKGSAKQAEDALKLAGTAEGMQVSADLITSVPDTTPASTLRDIDRIMEICSPDHISLYDLTIEETAELSRYYHETSQEDHLTPAWDHLARLGYRHYELSNFCLPGMEGKHNLRYWKLGSCIGLGCSAVSSLAGKGEITRYTGIHNVAEYTRRGIETAKPEVIDPATVLKDLIMVSLRTEDGIPAETVSLGYGDQICEAVVSRCRDWESRGFMDHLHLTKKGLLFMNSVIIDFFSLVDSLGITSTAKPLDSIF